MTDKMSNDIFNKSSKTKINVEASREVIKERVQEKKEEIKKEPAKKREPNSIKKTVEDLSAQMVGLADIMQKIQQKNIDVENNRPVLEKITNDPHIEEIEKKEAPILESELPVIESKNLPVENREIPEPRPFENVYKAKTVRAYPTISEMKTQTFNNKRMLPQLGRANNPYAKF